ncbi:MAG: HlyD family secretion protein [Legionellales bacterium]
MLKIIETFLSRPTAFKLSGMVILGSIIAFIFYLMLSALMHVYTDDATIEAHIISVMPKVSGYVTELYIDDNSPVNKDSLLVQIDVRDYKIKVDVARAGLDVAKSKLAEAQAQLAVSEAEAMQSAAEAKIAIANYKLAQDNFRRVRNVSDVRAVSRERFDTTNTAVKSGDAAVQAAKMKAKATEAQFQLAKVQMKTMQAAVLQAQAILAQAELNLAYTHITATETGTVAHKTVEAGNYAEPGQLLFYIVPKHPYVIANYKETQISCIKPGKPATIHVDAFSSRKLHGHVDSIQQGSGSRFALLPPENATGNFVKVIQRLPVKIVFDEPDDALLGLAPGMSVEVTIPCH